MAALLGSPGQANYSTANAALDAAAHAMQAAGAPALSVQWGAWAGAGMAAQDAQTAARMQRSGLGMLTASQGLAALEGMLTGSAAAVTSAGSTAARLAAGVCAAVPFAWERFMQRFATAPQLFTEFKQQIAAAQPAAGDACARMQPAPWVEVTHFCQMHCELRSQATMCIRSAGEAQGFDRATVMSVVSDAITSVLGATVPKDIPLMSAGLDSLGAVELR